MNPDIYVCGTGNVGTALIEAFLLNGLPIKGIYSKSRVAYYLGVPVLQYGEVPPTGSIIFLAIPDDVIYTTEKYFHGEDAHIIHCSGSVAISDLKHHSRGVFYPLQTWTRGMSSNWRKVPVLIESDDELVLEYLFNLANLMHTKPMPANSEQRLAIHVAAVFANNFSNAMFDIAFDLAQKAGFEPEILKPLIEKTAEKLHTLSPYDSQTGPAKRGDQVVIQKHLQILENNPKWQELYQLISAVIQNKHSK